MTASENREQRTEDSEQLNLDNKLYTVRRKPLNRSHISLDEHLCRECLNRICTYICPAEVYLWDESSRKIDVRYENCLECGACRVACDGIEWTNPAWGTGIMYKNS
jgi:ferredoxin like protein